jgi:hypothetical protein
MSWKHLISRCVSVVPLRAQPEMKILLAGVARGYVRVCMRRFIDSGTNRWNSRMILRAAALNAASSL